MSWPARKERPAGIYDPPEPKTMAGEPLDMKAPEPGEQLPPPQAPSKRIGRLEAVSKMLSQMMDLRLKFARIVALPSATIANSGTFLLVVKDYRLEVRGESISWLTIGKSGRGRPILR